MNNTTFNESDSGMTDEDWLNLGKSDAWAGKPKTPPQQDVQAASMYELGYSEGEIKHPPTQTPPAQQ
jgi:outer membrane protease